MKNTLLLFLLSIFFTGCIERGQKLEPAPVHTPPTVSKKIPVVPVVTSTETKVLSAMPKQTIKSEKPSTKKEISVEKNITTIPKVKVEVKTTKTEENDLFTLSEETKNRISGFFIIVIGLIILL